MARTLFRKASWAFVVLTIVLMLVLLGCENTGDAARRARENAPAGLNPGVMPLPDEPDPEPVPTPVECPQNAVSFDMSVTGTDSQLDDEATTSAGALKDCNTKLKTLTDTWTCTDANCKPVDTCEAKKAVTPTSCSGTPTCTARDVIADDGPGKYRDAKRWTCDLKQAVKMSCNCEKK
ncbi:MAG: hypothetical protein Q7S65_04130 [Nanoarchaeota archaeon]|nr:hypothetical protein [Nanoarchaeota archaeon]